MENNAKFCACSKRRKTSNIGHAFLDVLREAYLTELAATAVNSVHAGGQRQIHMRLLRGPHSSLSAASLAAGAKVQRITDLSSPLIAAHKADAIDGAVGDILMVVIDGYHSARRESGDDCRESGILRHGFASASHIAPVFG